MSTPVELAREEVRAQTADVLIAERKLADAKDEVDLTRNRLLRAQRELIRELDKLPSRSHKKKVVL